MMIKKFYILTFSLLIGLNSFSQQKRSRHLPAAKTKAEYQLMMENAKKETVFLGKGVTLPSNMRMPGEFEESKAVCISWAYDYDEFYNIL